MNRAKRKRIEVETKATGWLARLPVVQRLQEVTRVKREKGVVQDGESCGIIIANEYSVLLGSAIGGLRSMS